MVERDYNHLLPSKWLSWADLSISQGVGIILRPLASLSSPAAAKVLIRTATALSLQYDTCWIVLYREDQNWLVASVSLSVQYCVYICLAGVHRNEIERVSNCC